MVKAMRRDLEHDFYEAGDRSKGVHNPGLLLDYYLREIVSGEKTAQADLYEMVCAAKPSALYRQAYARWRKLHESDPNHTAAADFQAQGRLIVGLGIDSVRETGIALHPTYGVPFIPGSALKGLARAYARSWLSEHEDVAEDDYACLMQVIFGGPESASYIVWHDAWYVPGSAPGDRPLALDVMTPHHARYYTGGANRSWPTDFDDPTPVNFLSARGSYFIALRGPNRAWADRAMQILSGALADWGVGAKTSSGYGRLLGSGPPVRPEAPDTPAGARANPVPADHPLLRRIRSLPGARVKSEIKGVFDLAIKEDEPVRSETLKAVWEKLQGSPDLSQWARRRPWFGDLKDALGIEDDSE